MKNNKKTDSLSSEKILYKPVEGFSLYYQQEPDGSTAIYELMEDFTGDTFFKFIGKAWQGE